MGVFGQTYSRAAAASVALHAGLLMLAFIGFWSNRDSRPMVQLPPAVEVSLVASMPRTTPVAVSASERKSKPAPQPKPTPEPKPAPKPAEKPIPTEQEPAKPKTEPETRSSKRGRPVLDAGESEIEQQPETKKLPNFDPSDLEALAAAETDRLTDEQSAQTQQQADLSVEDQAVLIEVQRIKGLIQARIKQYFTLPPSVKPDAFVLLEIELFPDGQVRAVKLLQSSANRNLDRSALRAVQSAGYFDVPDDIEIFQRYFRRFNFRFQPDSS